MEIGCFFAIFLETVPFTSVRTQYGTKRRERYRERGREATNKKRRERELPVAIKRKRTKREEKETEEGREKRGENQEGREKREGKRREGEEKNKAWAEKEGLLESSAGRKERRLRGDKAELPLCAQ